MDQRDSGESIVRIVAGTMTGTSMDGIDVALARIVGEGLDIRPQLIRHASGPLGLLAPQLRAAAAQEPMTAGDLATLAWEFGRIHADLIEQVVGEDERLDLIAVHGQTVFHDPPISWQLLNPAPIAHQLGCPVVSALRQADLAAGGQGAPLSPLADWVLFRDSEKRRAILNLGGFCNMTVLPASDESSAEEDVSAIEGFDVCACNLVLNAVARLALKTEYDAGGAAANKGNISEALCTSLYERLVWQRDNERSLGTGDEVLEWVQENVKDTRPNDLAASAVMGIAMCVGHAINQSKADEAIVAGGGVENRALLTAIQKSTDVPLRRSDERHIGIPVNMREAFGMAALGVLCADGIPISLPQVTGCEDPAPVAGMWSMPYGWV